MDNKDLKIAAMRERLRDIIAEYEERVIELRVAITVEVKRLQDEIEQKDARIAELTNDLGKANDGQDSGLDSKKK